MYDIPKQNFVSGMSCLDVDRVVRGGSLRVQFSPPIPYDPQEERRSRQTKA